MAAPKLSRSTYVSRNVGDYATTLQMLGLDYEKVEDLRYGTNPHQTAAFYRPVGAPGVIGGMTILKTGKSGLSQTNLEDISYALNILKFFREPACACMKHVNPSGAAVAIPGDTVLSVYKKARDCDPRAAFGSVVAFSVKVDAATAREIMGSFVECVVAPDFDADALAVFNDATTYALNKSIRIIRCGDLAALPKFVGDPVEGYRTIKVLADGSLVVADPLLTQVRSCDDIKPAEAESKELGRVRSTVPATPAQKRDLLIAWYMNISVRSNGVILLKNGSSLAVGTGEQDRVGAVEKAVWKVEHKYAGTETIDGAAMASDGFFPFYDGLEVAAQAGVRAVIAPAGSLKDAEVIVRANELGVAFCHAPERVFSHH